MSRQQLAELSLGACRRADASGRASGRGPTTKLSLGACRRADASGRASGRGAGSGKVAAEAPRPSSPRGLDAASRGT